VAIGLNHDGAADVFPFFLPATMGIEMPHGISPRFHTVPVWSVPPPVPRYSRGVCEQPIQRWPTPAFFVLSARFLLFRFCKATLPDARRLRAFSSRRLPLFLGTHFCILRDGGPWEIPLFFLSFTCPLLPEEAQCSDRSPKFAAKRNLVVHFYSGSRISRTGSSGRVVTSPYGTVQ